MCVCTCACMCARQHKGNMSILGAVPWELFTLVSETGSLIGLELDKVATVWLPCLPRSLLYLFCGSNSGHWTCWKMSLLAELLHHPIQFPPAPTLDIYPSLELTVTSKEVLSACCPGKAVKNVRTSITLGDQHEFGLGVVFLQHVFSYCFVWDRVSQCNTSWPPNSQSSCLSLYLCIFD